MRLPVSLTPTQVDDSLAPPDVLVRRSAVLLYAIGIVFSQIAAHIGVLPVENIRLFELLGLLALGATFVTWRFTEHRLDHTFLVGTSVTGTLLIAGAVGLSGGSESPLWLYYLFPIIFNAIILRVRVTMLLLPIIVIASLLPTLVAQSYEPFMIQVLIVTPVYLAVTLCAQTLVRGLRRTSQLQSMAAEVEARLDEVQRWSIQLETIQSVAQQISGLTSVGDVANAIIEHTQTAISYDSARVYVREGDMLLPIAFRGSKEYAFQSVNTLDLKVGEGLTGWVAMRARSLRVDDVQNDARAMLILESPVTRESMLLSPLLHEGAAIGVIVLVRLGLGEFSDRELKLLDILAGQASNAVAKAWNFDAAHHQARTDGLTGLLNHRAMTEELSKHIQHSRSQGQPFSIAMLDADRFKRINDSHGHPAGDRVLQRLAVLLMTHCRTADLVVRYGGDEFLLIMPQTDGVTAIGVTRKVIDSIAAHRVLLRPQDTQGVNIRLSHGIATFPLDGSTYEELLEVADHRLYAAKASSDHFMRTRMHIVPQDALPGH